MVLFCALIRLLAVLCVQSKDVVKTDKAQSPYFSFTHQLDEGPLSGEVTFFVLPITSFTSQSESFQGKKVPKALKMPEIEESSSSFNCSTLLDSLKLRKNSIVLRVSSTDPFKLVYYKCSNPVTNLLAYFTVDHSIELENNKDLQHLILKFVSKSSLTYTKNKRILQNFVDFNNLVLNLDECIPCAINQFDLDLLSSDELGDVFLMLSNYNEVVLGSKYYYNLSIICEMDPSVLAATKLLRAKNFRQGSLICESFVEAFCETYGSISRNTPCSIELKNLIITLLEFANTCYSTYFYYLEDKFDYVNDYKKHYYGMILNAVNVIIHMYEKEGDLDFNYNTVCGNNGSQIKMQLIKHSCNYFDKNVYLKSCGVCHTHVYDIIAFFVNYNGYGDYSFRFIYDGTNYYIYDWCKSRFDYYAYTRTCFEESDLIAVFNLYYPAEANTNIQLYKSSITITESKTNSLSIRLDDHFFYYYFINYKNCNSPLSNGICASCNPNYFLNTDGKCYLIDTNCLNYNDPYLRCSLCKDGYSLTNLFTCEKCSENCLKCIGSNCIECEDGYRLNSDYTCSKCKDNCEICSFSLCISCIDGYFVDANKNCTQCEVGCSNCTDLYACSVCYSGYYLNDLDKNNVYCIECKDKCLRCDTNYCFECESFYRRNPNNLSECVYCNYSHCEECDSNSKCSLCYSGYALNDEFLCVNIPENSGCKTINSNFDCLACRSGYIEKPGLCESCINCLECNNSCKTCGEEEGKCLSCHDGFYLDQANSTCKNCISPCSTCTDSFNCSSCEDNLCLSSSNPYLCGKHEDCDKCLTNIKCRTCKYNMMIPSEIGCKCIDGYYRGSLKNCIKCLDICETCTNYTSCSDCKALNSTYYSNLGCVCDEGFYQDKEMNHSDACLPCNSTCKSCENENECLICKALNSTYDPNLGCLCNESFYRDKEMNNSDACMPCDSTCKECYTEKNCSICTSLNSSFLDECKCDKGFYQGKEMSNIDACIPCNDTCIECTDKDVCSVCTANNSKYVDNQGCLCDEGFFQIEEMNYSGACHSCNSTCKTCENETDCLSCVANNSEIDPDLGCVCKEGFYKAKEMNYSDACMRCNITCKECKEENICTSCAALHSTFKKSEGCLCDKGFYRIKEMNYSDACESCGPTCYDCKGEYDCSECVARYASNVVNVGCACDEGFYAAKTLNNFDACSRCGSNCKKCISSENCLTCQENYFLYKQKCLECGGLVQSTVVNATFLKSYIDVLIEFHGKVPYLNCANLFGKNKTDAYKFGKDFICQVKSRNKILIELGSNSILVNETVSITNFFLHPPNDNCMIKIEFEYPAALPYPVAKILFVPSIVYLNETDLEMNGELSSGWYKSELDYQWTINSSTSDLQDYSNSTQSSLKIPKTNLNEGLIDVELTVTNKFKLSHTVKKQVLCTKEIFLIVDFNTVSNYLCKISQNCEIFISKITPFDPEDILKYSWELTSGENLTVSGIELLNQSSVIIKPNSFRQGTIGLTVNVTNQKNITGSGQIFVELLAEKPIIVLDRAIGSFPLKADFNLSASQSMNTNLNCTSKDENCLKFNWTCYKDGKECRFNYDKNKDHISISKDIVKDKGFDSIRLVISSEDHKESRVHFSVDFVDIDHVPVVFLREYYSERTPSRIQLLNDFVVEAVLPNDNKDYLKYWVLKNNTKDVFLGNNSVIAVNKDYLKQGLDYRLTFKLIVDNFTLDYFYDFTVNSPPKPGEISVEPKSGIALIDKFDISATDWRDLESDLPLLYAFGYYSNLSRITLISKQPNPIFSTLLTFIGNPMHAFVQVYDSLGDFTEMSQKISVNNSKNIEDLIKKMEERLLTEMIQNIPSLISGIATGILNQEFYSKGDFSNSNSSEISFLQEGFELSIYYLDYYLNKTQNSKDLIDQISKILVELTLNPNLKSPNNANLIAQTMNILLDKSESLGLDTNQSRSFYQILENSFTHSAALISVNTKELSILTSLYEKVNKCRAKTIYLNQSESFKLKSAETKLIGLESSKLENSKHSLSKASVLFPEDINELNFTSNEEIIISLTNIHLKKQGILNQNLLIITIFNLDSNEQLEIKSKSPIIIDIPFKNENEGPISCLFFKYSTESWSNQGISMKNVTQHSIICECTHLSTFTAGNFQISPEKEIDFISLETIALYVCLSIFILYIIFAYLCYLKDRNEQNPDNILKKKIGSSSKDQEKSKNNSLDSDEPPIPSSPWENKEMIFEESKNSDLEQAKTSNLVKEIEGEMNENNTNLNSGNATPLPLKKTKKENSDRWGAVDKTRDENPDILNNSFNEDSNQFDRKEEKIPQEKNSIIQIPETKKEENKYEDEKLYEDKTDKNSFNLEAFSSKTTTVSESEKKSKVGAEALKDKIKKLSIYFYTDPDHCRLYRCSSAFFDLLGDIFFVTFFFENKTSDLSFEDAIKQYENVDPVSIIISFIILAAIQIIFHYIFKEEDSNNDKITNENRDEVKKKNSKKVFFAVFLFVILMILFSYFTIIIVQSLGPGVAGMWALTMVVSLMLEVTTVPILKILFLSYIWPYLKLWIKCFNKVHPEESIANKI